MTPTESRHESKRRSLVLPAAAAVVLIALVAGWPMATSAQLAPDVTVELCAKQGSTALPGSASADIWGFAAKPSGVDCTDSSVLAGLPGPLIEASEGNTVSVSVTNALSDPLSIDFPGIDLDPGETVADPGETVAYDFTANRPGTYVYVAGGDGRQAAMGLYGGLVVRPPTTNPPQAYHDPATAYDVERVAVLSSIDPQFNANPSSYNLLNWAPRYWLINGHAYPDTAPIQASPGQRVLLRYVNPGPETVTMTMLGAHAHLVAADAFPLQAPFDFVSQTFPAGETADAIVTVPPSASAGDRLAIYNRNLHLTNGSFGDPQYSPGGMMAFIDVVP